MSEFLKQFTTPELILAPLCILLLALSIMQYLRMGSLMGGNREWRDAARRNADDANKLADACRKNSLELNLLKHEIRGHREDEAELMQFIWGDPPMAGRSAGDVIAYIAHLRIELEQSRNKSAMLAEGLGKYTEQLRAIQKAKIAQPEEVTA